MLSDEQHANAIALGVKYQKRMLEESVMCLPRDHSTLPWLTDENAWVFSKISDPVDVSDLLEADGDPLNMDGGGKLVSSVKRRLVSSPVTTKLEFVNVQYQDTEDLVIDCASGSALASSREPVSVFDCL